MMYSQGTDCKQRLDIEATQVLARLRLQPISGEELKQIPQSAQRLAKKAFVRYKDMMLVNSHEQKQVCALLNSPQYIQRFLSVIEEIVANKILAVLPVTNTARPSQVP